MAGCGQSPMVGMCPSEHMATGSIPVHDGDFSRAKDTSKEVYCQRKVVIFRWCYRLRLLVQEPFLPSKGM